MKCLFEIGSKSTRFKLALSSRHKYKEPWSTCVLVGVLPKANNRWPWVKASYARTHVYNDTIESWNDQKAKELK